MQILPMLFLAAGIAFAIQSIIAAISAAIIEANMCINENYQKTLGFWLRAITAVISAIASASMINAAITLGTIQ